VGERGRRVAPACADRGRGRPAHIEDLQSKNGTKVRGVEVTVPAVLCDGDEFTSVRSRFNRESDDGLSTETAGVSL